MWLLLPEFFATDGLYLLRKCLLPILPEDSEQITARFTDGRLHILKELLNFHQPYLCTREY